jgi:hypothetical protein
VPIPSGPRIVQLVCQFFRNSIDAGDPCGRDTSGACHRPGFRTARAAGSSSPPIFKLTRLSRAEFAREQADTLAFADRNREIVELPAGLESGKTRRRQRGARTDGDCIEIDLRLETTDFYLRETIEKALFSTAIGADLIDLDSKTDQMTTYGRRFVRLACALGPLDARDAARKRCGSTAS